MKNQRHPVSRLMTNGRYWAAFVAAFFMLGHGALQAQSNSTESPYTRFGIGNLGERTSTASRAMGGIGIGLRSSNIINPKNPASYAAVDSLTFLFDFGTSIGMNWYRDANATSRRTLGNLEHITMLFPMSKYMSFSAGLLPFAQGGYQFGRMESMGGESNAEFLRYYTGKGNVNELYAGLSVEPIHGFSIGVNVSYLFGNITHFRHVRFNTPAPNNPSFLDRLSLQGLRFDVGAQWHIPMRDKKHALTIGAIYSPSVNLQSNLIRTNTIAGSSGLTTITRLDTISAKNAYSLPHSFGLGLTFEATNKWLLGADVDYSLWKNAKFFESHSQMNNRWHVAVGGQFVPDETQRSFWQRTAFRAGLHAENSYMSVPTVDGTYHGFQKLGASVGLGMPAFDYRSRLNVGLEYGLTLPGTKGMITEHSIILHVGLSFNEGWFRKMRIE